MRILFDSRKTEHKAPFGCIRQDEQCRLTVYIPHVCKAVSSTVIITEENGFYLSVPMKKEKEDENYSYYSCTFSLSKAGLYFYCFKITTKDNTSFYLYREGQHETNMGKGDLWQLTCFDKNYDTPSAFKGAVMYQIFPDRFYQYGECDLTDKLPPYHIHGNKDDIPVFAADINGKIVNNDFFGGNLKGITKKLEYLKDLSVNVIYLNPIFKAFSNHRYDTADYKTIDPLLGTEDDFKELCDEAHKLGIKILLDGVFSHTGDNSIYFDRYHIFKNGAISNPESSPYKDWYSFTEFPISYTSWWGIESLPCVNEMEPSYIDYIITGKDSVVEHWMKLGADGFRLDVADELPDEFIELLHKRVKEINPDGLVLGEVWEDASNKIAYDIRRTYFTKTELDSVMNYPFKNAVISYAMGEMDAKSFSDEIMTIVENYPKPVTDCLMNSLSTHDTARILTVLGEGDFNMPKEDKAYYRLNHEQYKMAFEREKLSAFLQFMLPGSSCIYYGDEIGMQGFEDPLNRGYFKWNDINNSLLEFYKQLAKIKSENEIFKTGDFFSYEKNGSFIAERHLGKNKITIIANNSDNVYETQKGKRKILFSQNTDVFGDFININKNGFILLK